MELLTENTETAEADSPADIEIARAREFASRLRVDPVRLTRPNVAIVGFTEHRKLAFQLGDDFEVWGINELHRYEDPSLFHRWFEVHDRKDLEGDAEHLKLLGKFDIPVYMHEHWDDIPASVPFPKGWLEDSLGRTLPVWSKYYTSSIAWEIALAIALGAREIHIYGVDMAQDEEYGVQRPCCEYWIGVAHGLGIKVYVPPTSDLGKCIGQYGFGDDGSEFALKCKERLGFLHAQDNDLRGKLRQLEAEYQHKTMHLDQQYRTQKDKLDEEYRQTREGLVHNIGIATGAIQDVEFWRRSWGVTAGTPGQPTPDRSKDTRTGIQPAVDAAA
jgi:hypothetical protein